MRVVRGLGKWTVYIVGGAIVGIAALGAWFQAIGELIWIAWAFITSLFSVFS